MAEVLVTFSEPVHDSAGGSYLSRACGAEMDDGRWQGWIEFEALDGSGSYRSPRETTQPNRTDVAYWATGLTPVYLEGALERTLRPGPVVVLASEDRPAFDGPLPPGSPETLPGRPEAVLNPFSVYRKGEGLLRRQLSALAGWHLVNIIEAYELSDLPAEELTVTSPQDLVELIVAAVRDHASR
jgi:hypothetical protein